MSCCFILPALLFVLLLFRPVLPSLSIDVINGLRKLTDAFQTCMNALGSENAYTSSTTFAVFEHLWEPTIPMIEDGALEALKPIGIAFQNALLERNATHYVASCYFKPAIHVKVNACAWCGGRVAGLFYALSSLPPALRAEVSWRCAPHSPGPRCAPPQCYDP